MIPEWKNSLGRAKAIKMCKARDIVYCEELDNFLERIHNNVRICGGELQSRQVIATAIENWIYY